MSDSSAPAPDSSSLRYTRQLILPEIGSWGQDKLTKASVLIVGLGGLGSPLALYLAAAGIGHLGLVDADTVDISNLQRQILYGEPSLGKNKTVEAEERLSTLNSTLQLTTHQERMTEDNADFLVKNYDIIVDATDNYETRLILNKACVHAQKPLVHGAIAGFYGYLSTLAPHLGGHCYQCMVPTPPMQSPPPGVMGIVPAVIGSMQGMEVFKLILGIGEPLLGKMWTLDFLSGCQRTLTLRRDPACSCCGNSSVSTQ